MPSASRNPAPPGHLPRLSLGLARGDWHGGKLAPGQTACVGPHGAEGLLTPPFGPDGQQDLGRPCSHWPRPGPRLLPQAKGSSG